MPGYKERSSILQDLGDTIFKLVCDWATPEQWAEWLRAPLEHAAATGAGGDIKAKAPHTWHTPLDLTVTGGKEAAAKALIMAGADGHMWEHRVAKDLLLSGANPIQAGSNGNFPIHLAACHGLDEVVLAVVEKGIDLNCLNNKREIPLLLALLRIAACENKAAAIRVLFEAGADIEARLTLFQLGAKVNSKENERITSLSSACSFGNHDAAGLLLSWGGDENAMDSEGETVVFMVMQQIAEAPASVRPPLERLSRLLARAPQDRAWRRRGFLVLGRVHPDRVRLAVEIPPAAADATEQPQQRPRRRASTGQVEVDGTNGGGGGTGASSGVRAGIEAVHEGTVAGFGGVSAWMMALTEEGVFRRIVGFL
ncbi:unnamed protein product [Ectocarpus sp. CCAP 1310/34]|nr:unnamed protein product [Ectocarpus sp. CCAP 1310/34]